MICWKEPNNIFQNSGSYKSLKNRQGFDDWYSHRGPAYFIDKHMKKNYNRILAELLVNCV